VQNRRLTDLQTIDALKRQARRLRIEANRAPAPLAAQFIALAEIYEQRASRMEAPAA
jgi:hypothetical protein